MREHVCVTLIALVLSTSASADMLPAGSEATCIETAARHYSLPVALLRAVRTQEGGSVGFWRVNVDGSIDYGVMQINSRWLPLLAPRGYTATALTYNACMNITAGAWILAHALADHHAWNCTNTSADAYWRAIGEYHSHTSALNRRYAEQVWRRYVTFEAIGGTTR
jgi:soluble lytic murein transglycosylase-like protein